MNGRYEELNYQKFALVANHPTGMRIMSENQQYKIHKLDLKDNTGVLFPNKKQGRKYNAWGQALIQLPGTNKLSRFSVYAYTKETRVGKTMTLSFFHACDEGEEAQDNRPKAYERPKPKNLDASQLF